MSLPTSKPEGPDALRRLAARLQRRVHERAREANPLFSVDHWKHGAGYDWPHDPDDGSYEAFENCKHPDCVLVRDAASALALRHDWSLESPGVYRCSRCQSLAASIPTVIDECKAAASALASIPSDREHEQCHDLVCNGDRRFAVGVKGHGCSCFSREKRERLAALASQSEHDERTKTLRDGAALPASTVPATASADEAWEEHCGECVTGTWCERFRLCMAGVIASDFFSSLESATPNPARLTPQSEGKALVSAPPSSSLGAGPTNEESFTRMDKQAGTADVATAPTDRGWRQAAYRVGEELSTVGPNGYYRFGPKTWRDWCLTQIHEQKAKPTLTVFSFDGYHEDDSAVLWWLFPIVEPPYVGTPSDSSWPFEESDEPDLYWTRLDVPGQTTESARSSPRGPHEGTREGGAAPQEEIVVGAGPGVRNPQEDGHAASEHAATRLFLGLLLRAVGEDPMTVGPSDIHRQNEILSRVASLSAQDEALTALKADAARYLKRASDEVTRRLQAEAQLQAQDEALEAAFRAGYHCVWTVTHGYTFDAEHRPGDPDGAYAAWLRRGDGPHESAQVGQLGEVKTSESFSKNATKDEAIATLRAALQAHDSYMLESGYEGPESSALHPKAAENWRRVRVALGQPDAAREALLPENYVGTVADYVRDLEAQLVAVRGESARRAETLESALDRERERLLRDEDTIRTCAPTSRGAPHDLPT
jgi:hypothetical protein